MPPPPFPLDPHRGLPVQSLQDFRSPSIEEESLNLAHAKVTPSRSVPNPSSMLALPQGHRRSLFPRAAAATESSDLPDKLPAPGMRSGGAGTSLAGFAGPERGLHVPGDSLFDSAHVTAAEPNKDDSRVATSDAGLLPSHDLSQHLTKSVTSTSTTPWVVPHSVGHAMMRSYSVMQSGTVPMPGPFGDQGRGKETLDIGQEGYPVRSLDYAPDNHDSRSAFWMPVDAAVQETYSCEDCYGTSPSTRDPQCEFPASSSILSSTDVGPSVTGIVDDTRPAVYPARTVPGIAVDGINSPGPSSQPRKYAPSVFVDSRAISLATVRTRCEIGGCHGYIEEGPASTVLSHLRKRHPGKLPVVLRKETKMQCPWPGCRTSLQSTNIGKHIAEIHLRRGSKTCRTCGRPFSRIDAYRRHMQRQHSQ